MQVVDLQEDKDFQGLNVQLLSISPDAVEDWREAGKGMGSRTSTAFSRTPRTRSRRSTE